ncbi:hypothetical protein ABPG74_000957 [Tetrahymena malaccensis]
MGDQSNPIYFQNEILFDNTPIITYENLNNERLYYGYKELSTQNLNYQPQYNGKDYAMQYQNQAYFQGYYEQNECYQPMNQNIGFSSYENINNGNNNDINNNTVPEPKLNQIYADSFVKQIFVSSDQNHQLNENAQNKNSYEIPYQQQQQFSQRESQQEQIVQQSSNNYENNQNPQQDNYNTQTNFYYSKYVGNDSDYQLNSCSQNPSNHRSTYSENEFNNQEEYSSYLKSQRAKEERIQKKQQKKQKLFEESQQLPKRVLRSQQIFNKTTNSVHDSDPSNQSLSTCLSYESTLNASENQSTLQRKLQGQLSNTNFQEKHEIPQQNENYQQINIQNQQNEDMSSFAQGNHLREYQVQNFSLEQQIQPQQNQYNNNSNNNNNIYYANNIYTPNNQYQLNEAAQEQLTSYDTMYSNSQIQNNQAIQKNITSFQENRFLYNNFENRAFHYNQNEKNSSYTDIISCNASEQLVGSNQQLNSQVNQLEYIEELDDQQDLAEVLNGIDLQAVTKKNVVKNIMSAFKRFICYIFEYKQNEKSAALNGKHHLFTKQQMKIYFQDNEAIAQQSIELCKDIILNIFKNSHSIPTQSSEMDFFKKFKRYINHKQFNNSTISLLIRHENYGPIFKFYLENYIQKWIDNSLNSNQKSHEDIIKYILCSFSNFKLLDQFIYRCKKQSLN